MLKDSVSLSEINIQVDTSERGRTINIICPVCKARKTISLPNSVINQASQLTTISISEGLVCSHHFQAFVDKQFKVRGYQKVDFNLHLEKLNEKEINNQDNLVKNDDLLFKNLILEENYCEFRPKSKDINLKHKNKKDFSSKNKEIAHEEMAHKDIYEEFWEFIDDDNYEFRELIIKDKKRRDS